MTERQINIFLTELRRHGLEATAAEHAGVSLRKVRAYSNQDDDFADAVNEALERAMDRDEAEARRRAVEGVDEPVIYQGQFTYLYEDVLDAQGNVQLDEHGAPLRRPVLDEHGNHKIATTKKYSDSLLALRLKGRRRRVYGDKTEITGAGGGPIEVQVKQFPLPHDPSTVIDITPNPRTVEQLIDEFT